MAWLIRIVIAGTLAVLLAVLHYYSPLTLSSVVPYTGLLLVITGLICLIRPMVVLCRARSHETKAASGAAAASKGQVAYTPPMLARDMREWIAARRALEAEECRSAGPASPPDVSWRQALSLLALVDRMIGWPVPEDEVRRREDAVAADAWRRLRIGFSRRPS